MFALPLWFLAVLLILLGAIWGSFVAALCSRWPRGESVASGRSCCDRCDQRIAVYDLIPLASYLLLKGKCRNCGQSIGLRPFTTELIAASIGVIPALVVPGNQAVGVAVFGWLLLPLILLDHWHLWLPNRLVALLAIAGVLVGPMLTAEIALLDRITGMFAGFLSLEIVRQIYKRVRRREGLGAGDPKLFGALGAWLGWQALPFILLGASALGLLVISSSQLTGNHSRSAFPFGSYMGVAAFVIVLM